MIARLSKIILPDRWSLAIFVCVSDGVFKTPSTFINKFRQPSSMAMMSFGAPKPDPLKMKLIVLSAATKALDFKKKNPDLSDDQVLQHITRISDKIIEEAR